MQAVVQSNRDEFKAAFSVFDAARKQLLIAIEENQTFMPKNNLASAVLSLVFEDLRSRPVNLTQVFEQLRPTATNLSQIGEQLGSLSFKQSLTAEGLPSFSTDQNPVFPDFTVEQMRVPQFEAQRGPRLDPSEWPTVPEELLSKPNAEIAQETQDYYLGLLERDELNGRLVLDEHERFYSDEIELAEASLRESGGQQLDDFPHWIYQTKRFYGIKLQALRRSRRLYMLRLRLSPKQTKESAHERVVRIGEALIDYESANEGLPSFKTKEKFYHWCGKVIGKKRSTVFKALSESNCLVKGRSGSDGEGLEETIELVMKYSRQHSKRNQKSADDD